MVQTIKELIFFSCEKFYISLQQQSLKIKPQTDSNLKIKEMNTLSLSENQSSSQLSRPEDQPEVESLQIQVNQELDPEIASRISRNLAGCIKKSKNQKFQSYMNVIVKLIEKGYCKEVAKFGVILQSMMDGFCHMTRQIEQGSTSQLKVMVILSTIAELIKSAPQLQISMKKRFLQCLFLIDSELLQVSPIRKQILAVLGVLYQCISKHTFILKKFQLLKQFKRAVLSNYSLVEQQFSCLFFNKAIYNLAIHGESITQADFSKYGVFSTLSRIFGQEQASIVIQRIKSALQKLKLKKNTLNDETKRSEMVAQN